MTTATEHTGSKSLTVWVQQNWRDIVHLPEPPTTFTASEMDLSPSTKMAMIHQNVVEVVGEAENGYHGMVNEYRLTKLGWEKLNYYTPSDDDDIQMLPCCEWSWIKGDRSVDGIRCGWCGAVNDREEVDQWL